jgi:hypothetical protein
MISVKNVAATFVFAVVALGLASCAEFERDSCASSADCRQALGFGSVCLDSGFCSSPGVNEKPEYDVPSACANGEVYPSAAAQNPELFGDAAVVGVVSTVLEPAQGVELAIREFEDAAEDSDIDVVAVNCSIPADANDVSTQVADATNYLSRELGANMMVVIGDESDLSTVKQEVPSPSPTILPIVSLLNDNSFGPSVLSPIPSKRDEIDAFAEAVSKGIGDSEEYQIRLLANNADFNSEIQLAFNDRFSAEEFQDTVDGDSDFGVSFFTCDCASTCEESLVRDKIDQLVADAQDLGTDGQELHLIISPSCSRANGAVAEVLADLASDDELSDTNESIRSITLAPESFSKQAYTTFGDLENFLPGVGNATELRGIAAAGNPSDAGYIEFADGYDEIFTSESGLAVSPLVAHAADATWLGILGYARLFILGEGRLENRDNATVRESILTFLDRSACEGAEPSEEPRCNLQFPRVPSAWDVLEESYDPRENPDLEDPTALTFQVTGASGPLRFVDNPNAAGLILEQGYYTEWIVDNPEKCLEVRGGEPGVEGGQYCSVLPSDPAEYVLYPRTTP